MKTNALPAVIMLTAGLIDCILSICSHLSLWRFTWQLLLVLVIFYVLGCIVKIILDCNFKDMNDNSSEEETESGEHAENKDGEAISDEEESSEKMERMDSGEESE